MYTSVAGVIGSPRICSGAAYAGVIGRPPCAVSDSSSCSSSLAMPKSSSLTVPLLSTRMFDGLRSRCTTSCWCAYATAAQAPSNNRRRWSIASPRAWSSIGWPSTYSNAKYGTPSGLMPASRNRAMLGWSSRARTFLSCRNRCRRCGPANDAVEHLQCDHLLDVAPLGQIDVAHPAAAQQANEVVQGRDPARSARRRYLAGDRRSVRAAQTAARRRLSPPRRQPQAGPRPRGGGQRRRRTRGTHTPPARPGSATWPP